MDINDYLPMFLAEAREHLQELNLAIVRIEEAPDDQDTVDAIFRIAHSLKGMSATMGFAATAALTHEMEDVLELLRRRSGGLDREAIDVLLECLDALEGAVEAVEATGTESLDPAPLVERLRSLARPRTPEQDASRRGGGEPPEDLAARAAGRRVLHATAQLRTDVSMPSIRAWQVLAAAGEHGEVLHSVPPEEDLDGFDGHRIDAWVATDAEATTLARALSAVTDVDGEPEVSDALAPRVVAATDADADAEPSVAAPAAPARRGAATVRVDAERLDQLMHSMGELVVDRTTVESLAAQADVPGLPEAIARLTRSSQALQQMVMQVRMIPVEAVFMRFPRLVRDLSGKLGKQVELVLTGKDTELDRTVVDALGDPLVHLLRNSLDHGLEPAEERVRAGKPATGRLELSARHAGGSVVITVRDDGRGIDPAKVAEKAVDRGLITAEEAAGIDLPRAVELLFTPGFSTAERTSDISGRGVGMDAVRAAIRNLGGEVNLDATPGGGTTAEIRLPLTLAIVSALLVEAGGRPFAIPLERVERTLLLADHPVRSAAGRRMLVLRDSALPLMDAGLVLDGTPEADAEHAVLVRGADTTVALAVGRLVGQREVVTRALPEGLAARVAVSGGAVLADGQIALIVDCDALAEERIAA